MNYLADLISRIRVAIIKRATFVIIKNTKECLKILTKLHIDGYILNMEIEKDFIIIYFNFKDNLNSIRDIKIISTPGLKKTFSVKFLRSKHNYYYEIYLMTHLGLLNKSEAIALNIGGTALLSIR
jgi:ribosomal protein S8